MSLDQLLYINQPVLSLLFHAKFHLHVYTKQYDLTLVPISAGKWQESANQYMLQKKLII